MRVSCAGQTMSITPANALVLIDWLQELFLQMDVKNNTLMFSTEKRGRNPKKPAGEADFPSCSHTPYLAIVSTGLHCNIH